MKETTAELFEDVAIGETEPLGTVKFVGPADVLFADEAATKFPGVAIELCEDDEVVFTAAEEEIGTVDENVLRTVTLVVVLEALDGL